MHRHLWGGLTVDLPFPLSDLPVQPDLSVPTDISVVVRSIPPLPSALLQIDDRQFAGGGIYLFNRHGVARYWVQDGRHIWIEPEPGVSAATIAAFLLGRPFAALACQRGWLSIHGGSAILASGACIFAAPAGTGKSTLLAALDRAGAPLLSDDAALVHPLGGIPHVWPSSQRFRLHPDSAARMPLGDRVALPVRENFAKVAIPFARPVQTPTPLAGIFLLERKGARASISEPLRLIEAIDLVTQSLNRPRLAKIIHGDAALLHHVTALVAQLPVRRLTVPNALDRIDDAVALLVPMVRREAAHGSSS